MTASTGTGEAMMARKACLVTALILLGIVAAVGLARPAYAQEADCRAAAAAQYQYEVCDEDATLVVPPRPQSPGPEPPGPRPGGGGTAIVEVDEPEGAAGAAAPAAEDQAASTPVAAVADPGGATASPTTLQEGSLPETGGPAALPIAALVVLVGTGIFGLRRVVRGRS